MWFTRLFLGEAEDRGAEGKEDRCSGTPAARQLALGEVREGNRAEVGVPVGCQLRSWRD